VTRRSHDVIPMCVVAACVIARYVFSGALAEYMPGLDMKVARHRAEQKE